MSTNTNTQPVSDEWTKLQRTLFRFAAIYFILYLYSFPLLNFLWELLVVWTGTKININIPDAGPNGSGDTTFNYVQLICLFVISVSATVIWLIADRKRKTYYIQLAWILTLLRYALIFYLLSYGVAKITLSQFPTPSLFRLMQSYGSSSPMGLA